MLMDSIARENATPHPEVSQVRQSGFYTLVEAYVKSFHAFPIQSRFPIADTNPTNVLKFPGQPEKTVYTL